MDSATRRSELTAIEGSTHWHQLARAAYEAMAWHHPSDMARDYSDIGSDGQRQWRDVAMSVAAHFGGKINGELVRFYPGQE